VIGHEEPPNDRIVGSNLAMDSEADGTPKGSSIARVPAVEDPSTNGAVGRSTDGRFAAGNRGGPGNPHARQVAALRTALLGAVTPDDVECVTAKLVELAKAGNVQAIREVFDRTVGRPTEADLLERIDQLERTALGMSAGGRR